MGKFRDLTNQVFGRLTALSFTHDEKGVGKWKCRCSCGNIVYVIPHSLISGITKSCGCYNREVASRVIRDITGQVFGRLTAMYPRTDIKSECRGKIWHCKCSCGKEADVLGHSLLTGRTRSCGCLLHKDLKGKRFGKLVAIEKTDLRCFNNVIWLCKCDCGNYKQVPSANLLNGTTRSCGCLYRTNVWDKNKKYHTPESKHLIHVFRAIRYRCCNSNCPFYQDYGGRGITICNEWFFNPSAFIAWSRENGYEKGLSIDRIDNDGPYAPWNCRWTTMKVQGNNRRSCRHFTYNGETHTLSEWADIIGVDANDLWGESDDKVGSIIAKGYRPADQRETIWDAKD